MARPYTMRKVVTGRHHRRPIALSWARTAPDLALRDTGIAPIGKVPWGTHLCLFYDSKQDLLDANVAFFRAALESNECGLWAISDPISRDDALSALRRGIPDFDGHLARGDMEVAQDGYLPGASHGIDQLLENWLQKYRGVLRAGREGLRISGVSLWAQTGNMWKDFRAFEHSLDDLIVGNKLLLLCAYALGTSSARDVLDVARAHQFTLARRNGAWETLEVPSLNKAQSELRVLNDNVEVLARSFQGRESLTPREIVVLAQIMTGASSKVVGRTLGISPRTVEFHRANIMQKLDVRNAVELVHKVMGNA